MFAKLDTIRAFLLSALILLCAAPLSGCDSEAIVQNSAPARNDHAPPGEPPVRPPEKER